jgi:Kef-type K+ transport system membrane component KefB
VTAAVIVQLTVVRLHLPGLVGLLLLGMALGPGGFEVLPREPLVEFLGHIGLVYVMFVAGLELDLDVVSRRRTETSTFGVLAFLLSLGPALVLGLAVGLNWAAAMLLGALLSSHTLLAYPIVHKLGIVQRRAVTIAVGGTLITDTLALIVLAVVIQQQGEGGWGLRSLLPLVLLAALAAFTLTMLPRLSRILLDRTSATRAEKALYVLAVLLILASVAELIGTEQILGAFLAGVALNRTLKARHDFLEHLEFAGRMFFIPFFFISTGMLLEIEVLLRRPEILWLAGLLVLIVLAGKSSAAWITGWLNGYSRPDRALMVGLTIPQAAATLAVAITAREAGLFGEREMDAVIVLIFVTCIAGPVLTRWAGGRAAEQRDHSHD